MFDSVLELQLCSEILRVCGFCLCKCKAKSFLSPLGGADLHFA